MGAAEILDIQAMLLERLTAPRSGFAKMILSQMSYNHDGSRAPMGERNIFVENLISTLRIAEVYHVSKDMTPLIQWAASQLDETDQFTREMAPSEFGLVRFEEPLIMNDAQGKVMKANLLVWSPFHIADPAADKRSGTIFYYLNDLHDPDDYGEELFEDYSREELISKFCRYMVSGWEYDHEHMRLGPAFVWPDEASAARLLREGVIPSRTTNMTRQFYAFWLLTQQTITRRKDAVIPRPFARRAKRMGLPPRVSIIHLRHESEPGEGLGETNVRWAHRWIVRGKWQWRACGQDHPYAQPYEKGWHCRVWIASYVKGPKHLPLVQSTKVYSLDR